MEWFLNLFKRKKDDSPGMYCSDIETETSIRELAFWSAVNTISSAVSKCEFKTYLNNKNVKKDEYYLWNVQPNKNQNSSEFIHEWIAKLYLKNECLIVENKGQLFVADSFEKNTNGLNEETFSEIIINDVGLDRTLKQSEVLYFKLANKDIKGIIDNIYSSYAKMISHGMRSYKRSRGVKGIFKYKTLPVAGSEARKAFDDLINNKFKKYIESSDAILSLGDGQEFEEKGSKTYANESTRDIRAMIDDIFDFTAKGFNIPPVLLKGEVLELDTVLNILLTFCIEPLVKMLSEEINRKRTSKSNFLKGTRIFIDTRTIKHIDIMEIADALSKLVSSACYNVNELRTILGEETIDEEWANKYYMTKNYGNIEEFLEESKKGEQDEEQVNNKAIS